ncbi:MAG: DUF3108 domain-containing protein [Sideroxydans sp.]|nr:DUF3108 domain-containing protein [Sideroxydans sp.]
MRRLARIIAWLLPFLAAPLHAAPLAQIHARYDVFKSGLKIAVIDETFARTQDHYRIESVTKSYGLFALLKPETIRITSEGNVTAQGLQPLVFDYRREHDSDKNAHADFDWQAATLALADHSGKRSAALSAGTQDRLSAMYQFMFWPLQHTMQLKFDMTNGSKLDAYSYLVAPGERVDTPLGRLETLYLASPPRASGGRTEIWLSRAHHNFPCKMVITEASGDKLTQTLTLLDLAP